MAAIHPRLTARLIEVFAQLSPRQQEILRELLKGSTNRQIAARLVISGETVKNRRELMSLAEHQ